MWRSLLSMLKNDEWRVNFIMLMGVGIFLLTAGVIDFLRHGQLAGMLLLFAFASIFIASACLGWYRRHRLYGDGPTTDEREQWIRARAGNAAGTAMLIVWASACLVPYWIASAQGQQTISINAHWLPTVGLYGIFIQAIVRAAATWLIRRKELSHGQR